MTGTDPSSARLCKDCDAELRPRQVVRCRRCRDAYNHRERRRRGLERKCFGPKVEVDEFILRHVCDLPDLIERVDDVYDTLREYYAENVEFDDNAFVRRDIYEAFEESTRSWESQHTLPPGLAA